MTTPVTMPKLGESVVEGTVARWLKAPGDSVTEREPLLEINTDKIDTEVPAPAAGTLLNIVVPEGETVKTGTVLAYIGGADELPVDDSADDDESAAEKPARADADTQGNQRAPASELGRRRGERPVEKPAGRAFISPVVKRIAAEHDVSLDNVQGTGARGRITKRDIREYVASLDAADAEVAQQPSAAPQGQATELETAPTAEKTDLVVEPLSLMRRAIAKHMSASKRTSPHVTTIFEVDMTAVVRHRENHKAALASKGVRLTFTAYFVAAVAQALRAVPVANARFVEDDGEFGIARSNQIHIGVAVALDDGLIVPVIRNADEQGLFGLARRIGELARDARMGQLAPDVTQGGTFTVTNHGVSGSLIGTPIINQPQAGILGIGAIVKRPIVRSATASLLPSADDAIVIRPMCYLNFSFDHRILDGAQADQFVAKVKDVLENWSSTTS